MIDKGTFRMNANIAQSTIQSMIQSIYTSNDENIFLILEILSPMISEIEYAVILANETIFNNKGDNYDNC